MKAISYEGVRKMSVSHHAKPTIQSPNDALLRVTTSGICGSDLHMYDGRTPLDKGTVVGHEIMGIIEEVGEAVDSIKVGDRVVLPFNIACGYCFNCHRGHTEACLTMNLKSPMPPMAMQEWGPIKEDRQNLYWCLTQTLTASNFLAKRETNGKMISYFFLTYFPPRSMPQSLLVFLRERQSPFLALAQLDCCPPTVPY